MRSDRERQHLDVDPGVGLERQQMGQLTAHRLLAADLLVERGLAEDRPEDRRLLLLENALAGEPHRGAVVEVVRIECAEHGPDVGVGLEQAVDHVCLEGADLDGAPLQLGRLLKPGRNLTAHHQVDQPGQ